MSKTMVKRIKIWYNNINNIRGLIFMEKVKINTEYITLGQFLKYVGVITNGGEAKNYLNSHKITINNEVEARRGRKIYPLDVIIVENKSYYVE